MLLQFPGAKRIVIVGRDTAAFSPLSLAPFIWLDPSDLSTLFQDAAMTTPVTADSDPVGAILDKSGNVHHLTQGTAANRPLYKTSGGRHWLQFDGTNDNLAFPDLQTPQPLEFAFACRLVYEAFGRFLAASPATSGSVVMDYGFNAVQQVTISAHDPVLGDGDPLSALADGTDAVINARYNGASSRFNIDNGNYVGGNVGAGGLGTSGNLLLLGGATGADPSAWRLYGMTIFDRLLADPEIAQLRTYLAGKQGRVL